MNRKFLCGIINVSFDQFNVKHSKRKEANKCLKKHGNSFSKVCRENQQRVPIFIKLKSLDLPQTSICVVE